MAVLEEEGYEVNEDLRELYEHVGLDPPGGEVMSERAGGKSSSPPRQSSTPIIPSRVLKHNGTVRYVVNTRSLHNLPDFTLVMTMKKKTKTKKRKKTNGVPRPLN